MRYCPPTRRVGPHRPDVDQEGRRAGARRRPSCWLLPQRPAGEGGLGELRHLVMVSLALPLRPASGISRAAAREVPAASRPPPGEGDRIIRLGIRVGRLGVPCASQIYTRPKFFSCPLLTQQTLHKGPLLRSGSRRYNRTQRSTCSGWAALPQ